MWAGSWRIINQSNNVLKKNNWWRECLGSECWCWYYYQSKVSLLKYKFEMTVGVFCPSFSGAGHYTYKQPNINYVVPIWVSYVKITGISDVAQCKLLIAFFPLRHQFYVSTTSCSSHSFAQEWWFCFNGQHPARVRGNTGDRGGKKLAKLDAWSSVYIVSLHYRS